MSGKREKTAMIGFGVAACAACCAGPVLSVLAAIGLGAAAGFALFGAVALAIGATAAVVVLRRRRRGWTCTQEVRGGAVAVELSKNRASS